MSTTFRSRAVSEDGYYQIDFTVFGISLTKITKDDSLLLPMSHWVYLLTNQYIEGSDYHNYNKRMDVGGLQPPTGFINHIPKAVYGSYNTQIPKYTQQILTVPLTVSDGIYIDPGFIKNEHVCKFVPYVGLIESFNHCESCGKKQ